MKSLYTKICNLENSSLSKFPLWMWISGPFQNFWTAFNAVHWKGFKTSTFQYLIILLFQLQVNIIKANSHFKGQWKLRNTKNMLQQWMNKHTNAIGTVTGAQTNGQLNLFCHIWLIPKGWSGRTRSSGDVGIISRLLCFVFVISSSVLFVWSVGDSKLVYPQ